MVGYDSTLMSVKRYFTKKMVILYVVFGVTMVE